MIDKNSSFEREVADVLSKAQEEKGNVRGEILRNIFTYILAKKGKEGVRTVEEKLKELGHSLKFEEIHFFEWYPNSLALLVMLVIKKVFNWSDSDFFNMGNSAPKFSFIIKMMMKYLISVQKVCLEAQKYWEKHFDFGELEPVTVNEKEKYIIVRVKGHKFISSVCAYNAGYFLRVLQFCVKSKNITINETKCMLRGAPYHEFVIKWE